MGVPVTLKAGKQQHDMAHCYIYLRPVLHLKIVGTCLLQVMGVMELALNEDTLFHALALHEPGQCGWALRAEVALFLEYQAVAVDVEGEWAQQCSLEAGMLRDGGGYNRHGSEVSAMGYSALRGVKVLVHQRQTQGPCEIQDVSHPDVASHAPIVHVLHYGQGHYDGLVEIQNVDDVSSLEPAWEQPLPDVFVVGGESWTGPRQNILAAHAPCAPPWLASYQSWLRSLANRRQSIPGYVVYLLSVFVSLVVYGRCSGSFCGELQGILQRRLPGSTPLPNWLNYLLHGHRFT